jgi:hypothetical protein
MHGQKNIKVTAVYCANHTDRISVLCEKKAGFITVKANDTYLTPYSFLKTVYYTQISPQTCKF